MDLDWCYACLICPLETSAINVFSLSVLLGMEVKQDQMTGYGRTLRLHRVLAYFFKRNVHQGVKEMEIPSAMDEILSQLG